MITLLLLLAGAPEAPAPDPRAVAIVDSAIVRLGGAAVLGRLERVRYELVTQWQRAVFDDRPYADQPSYEWHSDLRDYTIPAWRNTRRFSFGGQTREITDLVRDSVAVRRAGEAWGPLSVAYVDERHEVFTFAAERLLLLMRRAPDLRALPDTAIAGVRHARVAGTVEGFPATLFVRQTDGLPAMVRWVAAHPNDFGLVPLGTMEVELWYSNWQRLPAGVNLPMQWDVKRAGTPYKRLTVLDAKFGVEAADSFAVTDSLRAAFLATQRRPMHDVPFDGAALVDGAFVAFNAFGAPAGAVRVGGSWVLLETGQAPLSAERALAALASLDPAPVAGAVVTMPAAGNGGAVAVARRAVPLHVAPGAMPFMQTVFRNHGEAARAPDGAAAAGWVRVGADSLWLEPIDLPDAPGAMLVYVPALRYVYSALAAAPLQREYVLRRMAARGWPVDRIGTARAVSAPAAP